MVLVGVAANYQGHIFKKQENQGIHLDVGEGGDVLFLSTIISTHRPA